MRSSKACWKTAAVASVLSFGQNLQALSDFVGPVLANYWRAGQQAGY